jgi:hypothetical protein
MEVKITSPFSCCSSLGKHCCSAYTVRTRWMSICELSENKTSNRRSMAELSRFAAFGGIVMQWSSKRRSRLQLWSCWSKFTGPFDVFDAKRTRITSTNTTTCWVLLRRSLLFVMSVLLQAKILSPGVESEDMWHLRSAMTRCLYPSVVFYVKSIHCG